MKTIKLLGIFILISAKLLAQSTTIEPHVFRLSINETNGGCDNASDIGKIFYTTSTNKLRYCKNNATADAEVPWIATGADISYFGKVGIKTSPTTYDFDLFGNARSTNFYVEGNLGIGTTTPTEKVEINNRPIGISSTADATRWQISYTDAGNWFEFRENGSSRILFKNGGNVSINNTSNTNKLDVNGDASFAGSVAADGGGLLANTNATQLKMATFATSVTSSFSVSANGCNTIGFGFVNGAFSAPPAVMMGHKLTGSTNDNHLVFTITNVTTNSATLNICNNSASTVAVNGYSYSCVAIGQ